MSVLAHLRGEKVRRWLWLVAATLGFDGTILLLGLPAALLLGSIFAGITMSIRDRAPVLTRWPVFMAQALIGCSIAQSIPISAFGHLRETWPAMAASVVFVLLAASAIGCFQMRTSPIPGTAALWGSSPGAAMASVVMAESFGDDVRLVALMQYIRVVLVAFTASLVAHVSDIAMGLATPFSSAAGMDAIQLLATCAVAVLGVAIARRASVPAGTLMLPMVLCIALSSLGILVITMPGWLLAIVYTVLGWDIGLRFSRAVLRQSLKLLPSILASTLALIVSCAAFSVALSEVAGVDRLTAFLATSPGGVDAIAVIASSNRVDVLFIMSLQTARLFVVVLAGPPIIRFLAVRFGPK